jgi:hypothetical protein
LGLFKPTSVGAGTCVPVWGTSTVEVSPTEARRYRNNKNKKKKKNNHNHNDNDNNKKKTNIHQDTETIAARECIH